MVASVGSAPIAKMSRVCDEISECNAGSRHKWLDIHGMDGRLADSDVGPQRGQCMGYVPRVN